MAMYEKITRQNYDGLTYRASVNGTNTIEIRMSGSSVEAMGSIIDRLGQYERLCMDPDEVFRLMKQAGLLPKAAIEEERIRRLDALQRSGL